MAAQEWDPLLPNNATGRNYTGILTKTIVYGLTLLFFFVGGFIQLLFLLCCCYAAAYVIYPGRRC
jgi:hypothetical protein